jgi:FdhD protein
MQNPSEQTGLQQRSVVRWQTQTYLQKTDVVAIEEPFEMQISFGPETHRSQQALSITMRTPGQDADLFTGFLFTEGIINKAEDIVSIGIPPTAMGSGKDNVMLAELSPSLNFDAASLSRNFYTTSSCGVCGKTSIDLVETSSCYLPQMARPKVEADILCALPETLRNAQSLFEQTGGIHAAGLFDSQGNLIMLREDVGRHNALDKLIGAALMQGLVPLHDHILLLSGRISFELVQKAAMAGIPIIGAVGAPSSLAIELASDRGITLAGFLRPDRLNLYSDQNRVVTEEEVQLEA